MYLQHAMTVAALATITSAVPFHVLHEKRSDSSDWVKRARVVADLTLPMRIGLTQSNLEQGHDLLMELSSPESPRYGKHYTAQEVHDLFAPSADSVTAVRNWLEAAGIKVDRISQSLNKQWIQVDATVSEIEDLLHTEYYHYENGNGGTSLGCEEYHVRESLAHHIDYITPGVKGLATSRYLSSAIKLEKRMEQSKNQSKPAPSPLSFAEVIAHPLAHCDQFITPQCISHMYNISKATTAHPGNELGVFEKGSQYDQTDLDDFFSSLQPRIPNGTHPISHSIDGGVPSTSDRVKSEANLDLMTSYPIIWPQQSVLFATDDPFYTSGGTAVTPGFLNTFLDGIDGSYCNYSAFGETGNSKLDPKYPDPNPGGFKGSLQCGVWKPTNVISISYSIPEHGQVPPNYQRRQCSEYMKLGMQGVSVVFSSGDQGVVAHLTCIGPGKSPQAFNPEFPINCPYVTTVGGTKLPLGASADKDQEVAADSFKSGGGFSNIFARPSYQDSAVRGFFKSPGAPTFPGYSGSKFGDGLYNRSGRGFPDVSAVGQSIFVFGSGSPTTGGGTSASAPIFASLLNRINEVRLAAGKSTVGFVNPVLYANPGAFHDITRGENSRFCNFNATTGTFTTTKGFNATIGWDPVTGLGTPNYPALLDVFTHLP